MSYIPCEVVSESKEATQEITEKAAVIAKEECGIDLEGRSSIVYDLTEIFFRCATEYLRNHNQSIINIGNYIRLSTVEDKTDGGEKDGNIVPVVEIGEKMKLGVKNDADTEEDED